MRVTRELGKHA